MVHSTAALILILILCLSTPSATLCIPSHYSFPAIKSICVDYVCSVWSLLIRANQSEDAVLITPRNLFLLVNLIILCLFISLHLQHHAPASEKRSSRKKKLIAKDYQAEPQRASLIHDLTSSAAASMANKSLSSSVGSTELLTEESLIAASLQETSMEMCNSEDEGSQARELSTFDSDHINGSDVEQIVLDEDGRLRLIGEPKSPLGDMKGSDAERKEIERLRSTEAGNRSDAEKIVLDENGQLKLIESPKGSDADKIVLDEDGRLRLIDRPKLPFRSKPQKSLSTGHGSKFNKADNQDDINNNTNYEAPSLDINLNYDIRSINNISPDKRSLNNNNNSSNISERTTDKRSLNNDNNNNNNYSNISERTTDTPVADLNLSNADGSPRASSRPSIVKKSESLDATWRAINKGRGSSAGNRDHKHSIRQSKRQDFKPPTGRAGHGLMRASHANNGKMRREPSISQDELNAKVESFIANFNEQIRIQRQQSLLSYMQMVDRGA